MTDIYLQLFNIYIIKAYMTIFHESFHYIFYHTQKKLFNKVNKSQ